VRGICDTLHLTLHYNPNSGDLTIRATLAPDTPAARLVTDRTELRH
jgi:hypothetical protein